MLEMILNVHLFVSGSPPIPHCGVILLKMFIAETEKVVGGECGGRPVKWTQNTCQKRRKAQEGDLGKNNAWLKWDKTGAAI